MDKIIKELSSELHNEIKKYISNEGYKYVESLKEVGEEVKKGLLDINLSIEKKQKELEEIIEQINSLRNQIDDNTRTSKEIKIKTLENIKFMKKFGK